MYFSIFCQNSTKGYLISSSKTHPHHSFTFDLFEQQEIPANTPLCFLINQFQIQNFVAPFKYGDVNALINFPVFEIQLTNFKTLYPASHYYTAANTETRLWCKKCSCSSQSATAWTEGDARKACNRTLERYYGNDFQTRIKEMHPMTWPTCNYRKNDK